MRKTQGTIKAETITINEAMWRTQAEVTRESFEKSLEDSSLLDYDGKVNLGNLPQEPAECPLPQIELLGLRAL